MIDQRLQLKLGLKLSPQQIQLMKLLQVPTAQLEQRIKEEIEANPALEEGENDEEEIETRDETSETPEEEKVESENENETETEPVEEEPKLDDDLDMSEYYDEDDEGVAEYKTKDPSEFADPDDASAHPASGGNHPSERGARCLDLFCSAREHRVADQERVSFGGQAGTGFFYVVVLHSLRLAGAFPGGPGVPAGAECPGWSPSFARPPRGLEGRGRPHSTRDQDAER